jgi:hypothetical protein
MFCFWAVFFGGDLFLPFFVLFFFYLGNWALDWAGVAVHLARGEGNALAAMAVLFISISTNFCCLLLCFQYKMFFVKAHLV